MNETSFLYQAIVYLAAAVIAVPISKRLGLGSVIGYLAAGIAIGPHGLKLIGSVEDVMHFAEFGVVLLLFLIGLELNPQKLWRMRKPLLVMGGLQVGLTLAAFYVTARWFHFPWRVALIAAMGFCLSSTAMAVQIMREKNLLQLPGGQNAFSVLLFQDLAVIPMLAVLPYLAVVQNSVSTKPASVIALQSIAAIFFVVFLGRYLISPVFRFIARTGLREIFTAFSLFLVIAIAALMQSVGLSMALGSFLAGVLLAESEYRHALETDLEPFKGLLVGLFFISVGMSVNGEVLLKHPALILALVVGLLTIKMAVLLFISQRFKLHARDRNLFTLLLSQGGEFAFVLFNVGHQAHVIGPHETSIMILVVALSMVTTPFLMMADERWLQPRYNRGSAARAHDTIEPQTTPVIIAGFGRFGQIVGRMLHARNIATTILDQDPNQVDLVRTFGWKAFYGDVTRLDLLEAAGANHAQLLILAIDDMPAALKVTELVRQHFPHLKILARARSRTDAFQFVLRDIPAVREVVGSSIDMAERALKILGHSAFEARQLALKFQIYDDQLLAKNAIHHQDTKMLINMAQQGREELAKLMQEDQKKRQDPNEEGWS